jgi:translation initiation factor IF-3
VPGLRKPPVCKLLDFSKHTYEAMKKAVLGRRKDEPDHDPE